MVVRNQVQLRYLLIGSGRLATHLQFYFQNLQVPLRTWARNQQSLEDLRAEAEKADVILLAITDRALPEWTARPEFQGKTVVHFAGSLHFPGTFAFHPLMTFTPRLYPPEFYPSTLFVKDRDFDHQRIFPFFQNPVVPIDPDKRVLYHALCNMAANFPALLWVHLFKTFETELNLPPQILEPLVRQVLINTLANGADALAGPFQRGDWKTIDLHSSALSAFPDLQSAHRHWHQWAASLPQRRNK